MSQKANPLLEFSRRPWAVPAALFAFALALRLLGIGWGLKNDLHNQSYHPDELLIWSQSQRVEPARGKFTPGFYNYGTLYLTQLRIASDMVGAYAGVPLQGDADSYWTYVSRCHLAGRIISAVAGALTVLLLFLMLRPWVNDVGSSMGALLVAVAPAHVVHSRFQTVDVMATFLLAAGAYFALRLLGTARGDRPTTPTPVSPQAARWGKFISRPFNLAAAAGVCAGLSAGTKYTGGMVILSLLAVVILLRGREAWARLAAGFGGFLLAFLLSTPGVLFDSAAFWRDFAFEMRHTATGHGLVFVDLPSGFVTHLTNLTVGIGPVLFLLGLIGLTVAAVKKQTWVWALLAFGVPYYLVIGRAEVMFLRYTFPLYLLVAAGFAYLMGLAHENKGRFVYLMMLGIAALGGVDPGGLRMAALFTVDMSGEDPRDEAARYLKKQSENKPDSSVGLVSDPWFYTPPLYPDSTLGPPGAAYLLGNMMSAYSEKVGSPRWRTASEAMVGIRDLLMSQASEPRVELLIPYRPEDRILGWDAERLNIAKPDFVVFSSFEFVDRQRLYGREDLDAVNLRLVDQTHEFLLALPKSYEQAATFGGFAPEIHDLEYISPSIAVWKRKQP